MEKKVKSVGILTVSDRCSQGTAEDKSGPALKEKLISTFGEDLRIITAIVPDENAAIQQHLLYWSSLENQDNVEIILTTGGTGFAPRDITPEATKPLLHKECPGIVNAMINFSLTKTPFAALSRPAAGIRDSTLIINLPGSVKGAVENLEAIISIFPHAVALIRQTDDKDNHNK